MKSRKIIKGIIFLVVGLILLANTLGMLDWSVWYNVVRLWPILLVSAGLSMIFRERTLSFLGPLIILLAIIFGVWTSYSDVEIMKEVIPQEKILSREITPEVIVPSEEKILSETETAITPESTSVIETATEPETPAEIVSAPAITKTLLELNFDLGTLSIQDSTNQLYECLARYGYKEFEPFETYSSSNGEAYINISHAPVSRRFFSGNVKNHWHITLNKDMVYDLHINSGAINAECNLSEFKVEELSLESGASNIELIIPEFDAKIMIDAGVSNIDIGIPENVGVILKMDTGIAIKNLDNFVKDNNTYTSKNYNEAEFKTSIELDCGLSNINIYYI